MTSIHKKLWHLLKLKPILAIVTVLIVIALIATPFFYSLYWSQKEIPAIDAIPTDAAIILKVNNLTQTWPLITSSQIWKNFTREKDYENLESKVNNFFKIAFQNSGFAYAIRKFPLYISLHPLHEGGAGLLYSIQTGHAVHDKDLNPLIQKYFGSNIQIVIRDFAGVHIREIIFKSAKFSPVKEHVINIVLKEGILMASDNTSLINEAILTLKSGESITSQKAFMRVSRTESQRANAVLYINYHNLPNIFNDQLDARSLFNISGISTFSEWTELDILIKEKQLLMNGFSSGGESANTFLKLFNDQHTTPSNVESLMPDNTAAFINIGFKDYTTIFRRLKLQLKKQNKLDTLENRLKAISDSFNIDAEQTLTGWVKSEMGIAITNNLSLSEEENVYAYFKTSSPVQAESSLSILSKANSMVFNGITIHVIEYPSLLPSIYGILFPDAKKYYFALAGDYVVFARSVNAMTAFLSSYTSKNTLANSPSFQNFKNYISGTSNIWVYADLSQIVQHILTLLIPGDKQNYPIMQAIRSAKLISTEFSLENNLFYTSVCIANDTTNQASNVSSLNDQFANLPSPEWGTYIGTIRNKPVVVKTEKGYFIFVIDESNKIWCINDKGGLEWSHLTGGHILGDLRIIDFQGHKCIAFNSSDLIYLLKTDGNYENGFPLKLPFNATNGLTPYSGGQDGLSFFLATSKNNIQAITVKGKKLVPWIPVEMKARVIKPVEITDHFGKKLIAIVDEAGRIKIADIKGLVSGNFDKVPNISSNTQIWPNRVSSKGDIICAAADGDLLFIKKDGMFDKIPFETIITNPFFLIDQYENNGKLDYIFMDQARMTVFNTQNEIIYEYDLSSFPRFQPLVFIAPDNRKYYLVTAGNNRLLLFNSQGIMREFPDIKSETPPAILPIEGTRSAYILTIEKQFLNAYKYTF
ncbi:MAG: DUF3352 domain-containing protein [Bacteroidota bacterium]|nr:DUF3352 domain-containing protein [Bacteroidota bacterium]